MEDNVAEGIIGRKLVLCPKLQTFEMDELVRSCGHCDNFLVYCCSCSKRYDNDSYREEGRLCHHFRLIFTDGACRSNGRDGATAGIGVAATEDDSGQWSIPVTGDLDMGQKRTSQRAELLAAQAGLRYLIISSPDEGRRKKGRKSGSTAESRNWIIATDSEYVVKGVTEWLPAWKVSEPFLHSFCSLFEPSFLSLQVLI